MNAVEALRLAVQHQQNGRLREAAEIYERVLAQDPFNPDAHHLVGVLESQFGNRQVGIDLIRRAIQLNGAAVDYHINLGVELEACGRTKEAIDAFRSAIAISPDDAVPHNNLGNVLFKTAQPVQAIAHYRRAIALCSNYAEAHSNLGNALLASGAVDEAIAACNQAIRLRPGYAEAQLNLANALMAAGRHEDAVERYQHVLELRADLPQAHANLGNALFILGRLELATICFQRALALRPDSAEIQSNLGSTFKQLGRFDDAIAACRKAIALDPKLAMAHLNLSLMLLARGEFQEGWREYEWRWKTDRHWPPPRELGKPAWGGEPLLGRTILIHAEQGFGDTIQFVRYAPLVAAHGGRVVLECQPQLLRLLGTVDGVADCISMNGPLPHFDLHCPLLSLPRAFETRLDSIPAKIPYLVANQAQHEKWKQKFSLDERIVRVGVCCAGRPSHSDDRNRSIPPAAFSSLSTIDGLSFHSLQKTGEAIGINSAEDLNDFADTAALVSALDLVITVDTAVAHLAGALGKWTWVLLPFVADWRWLLHRSDSPWYPTMRLFRQPRAGDWESPLAEIAHCLKAEIARRNSIQ